MARRIPTIGLEPILAELAAGSSEDEIDDAVLAATMQLLTTRGLRHWSIDDVADAAGIGRTSVYRRFGSRDVLVHASLGRDLRQFFSSISEQVAVHERTEDRVVEGLLAGLAIARDGVLIRLARSDPATFLPLLTTEAGPLVDVATTVLTDLAVIDGATDRLQASLVAETLVRLAISFLFTPGPGFLPDDPAAARSSLHAIVDPLVASVR